MTIDCSGLPSVTVRMPLLLNLNPFEHRQWHGFQHGSKKADMFRRPPHAARVLQHVHQVLVEVSAIEVVIPLPENVLGRYVCHRGAQSGTQVER
jgi:hypothetical protein